MFICVYMYIHRHTYTHAHVCVYAHMCICTYVCMYISLLNPNINFEKRVLPAFYTLGTKPL